MPFPFAAEIAWVAGGLIAAWMLLGCLKAIGAESARAIGRHRLRVEAHRLRLEQQRRLAGLDREPPTPGPAAHPAAGRPATSTRQRPS